MMIASRIALLFFALSGATNASNAIVIDHNDEVVLESFDDAHHVWTVLNDPIMGGESESEVTLKDDYANFDGKVVDNSFLSGPGFISMSSVHGSYPDVSACTALKLVLMATEKYKGFRVSFGMVQSFAFGYKADFDAPYNTFGEVVVPFKEFSAAWDDNSGNQVVTCQQEPKYCPDKATLQDMATISLWGEGVAGNVHLKVKSISAVGCDGKMDAQELVGNFQVEPKAKPSRHGGRLIVVVAIVVAALYVVASKRRRSDAYDPVDGINMNLIV